jgi:hypothetical protein
MTYHFNLTIPTELNKDGEIKDKVDFIKHQRTIRLFQWLSLFMVKFGSSDYLSHNDTTVNLQKHRSVVQCPDTLVWARTIQM